MSATTTNLTFNDYAGTSYIGNVAAAARQLLAALLAVKPQAAVVEAEVSERGHAKAVSWMYRLANDCEHHSPSLSAELRYMASRG